MKAKSTKQVLDALRNDKLSLYRGDGYWYFVYDDGDKIFETQSVYIKYLSSLELSDWLAIGRDFIDRVESKSKED